MRRLPKARFFRGLLAAKMATERDIPLIRRKLADFRRYQSLNVEFTNNRGHRWANRLQSFANWLWENREAILRILGLVIMFADDGTPRVVDADELDEETLKRARQNLAKRKPTKVTPHGEKVEDFTETSPLDEITSDAQEAGLYDIGLNENPLIKGESNGEVQRQEEGREAKAERQVNNGDEDEVQSGEDRGEDTDRYESDDV
jgi:hypothetical protein